MRKAIALASGIFVFALILLSVNAAANPQSEISEDALEQVILRLLHQATSATVDDYYGEHRQYWRQNLLSIQKVPQSPYYEAVIQVETFYGAHNPPYGIETIVFQIGILGEVQMVSYDHQDEQW